MSAAPESATKWHKFDPRPYNYESCNASQDLNLAEQFLTVDLPHESVKGWRTIDTDRTAFLIEGDDGDDQQWIVTIARDADGDSEGYRDCSSCVSVEVTRV